MPQRILALELDAYELKAAMVESTFRDYRIAGFYREPLEDGARAERLRQVLQQHAFEPTAVLTSLPGDLVTLRTFFLPFRDRKRLEQTVPFELETQVPFGLDDVIIDYHVLQRDRAGSTVLAALVQRRDLEEHLTLLREAGIDPKIVDFAPLATLNVLSLVGSELPDTFVYIGGCARRVIVALYRNRHLVGLRTIVPETVQAVDGDSVAAANGHATHAAAERVESVLPQIRWTLLAINGAPLEADLTCIVGGDGLEFEALADQIGPFLDVTVRRLSDTPLRNVPQSLRPEVPSFVSPLGLALREVAPNEALGVNFRRGEFAYHRGQDELRRAFWRTGTLAGVVIALVVANTYMSYRQLSTRLDIVQAQIRNVFTQTLPDVKRVVDEKTQLQSEIDAAQKKLQVMSGLAPVNGATAIDVMRTISAAVPDSIKVDADEYIMEPDSVRIKAKTESFENVDTVKQQLLNTHYFGDVQVKDVKTTQDGKVDFRVILAFSKEAPAAGAATHP